MTITFSKGDMLTLPNFGGTVWLVTSVRTRTGENASRPFEAGDDPVNIIVGLTDVANQDKHGTALNAATLADRMRDYTPAGTGRVEQIGNLTADILTSAGDWMGAGSAEKLARRLVDLGWNR